MLNDPAEILRAQFPKALLNFDVAPSGTTIGPLHAIFTQVGQAIANFGADSLLLQAQLSVQHAAGEYLDKHGAFYGVLRRLGELDEPYRARILLALHAGKLTIPAIQAAVTQYFSAFPYPTEISVFSLQSNPAAAAAITYVDPNGVLVVGLPKLDFVISISVFIPASLTFFAGRSYIGRNSYVISTAPDISDVTSDLGLADLLRRTDAGGTHPVYEYVAVIQAHV